MDEQKRNMFLAISLSLMILLGWQFFFAPPVPQKTPESINQSGFNGENALIPQLPSLSAKTGDLQSHSDSFASRDEILKQNERIYIETPFLRGSINLQGARIDDLSLIQYKQTLDSNSPYIELFSPAKSVKPYYSEFGWVADKTQVPNAQTVWQSDDTTINMQNTATLFWINDSGVRFELHFKLDERYMFIVQQRVVNNSSQSIRLANYALISRTSKPDTLGFYILHEGPIGVLNDTLEELDYEDLEEQKNINTVTLGGWLGITDKYWLSAIIPNQQEQVNTQFRSARRNNKTLYQTDFIYEARDIDINQEFTQTSYLFAGAKETTLLDTYAERFNITNFDLAVDFGWFYFLTKPIFYAIHWLNSQLGNFGLAILALTIFVKLLLFPLANKSYVSMSKMKLLQPQMLELKERHGDDKMKLQQEMMALYKREKVNPAAGCLPILIQIPVFFSLYKVLFVTIEMRHAPFFGWIHDLSAADPLGILTLFGLIDWQVPALLVPINLGIWPLIMGLTMWLQQKLNPTPADPIQAKVFMIMPFLFTFLLATFPAGLVIYWAWNNVLSIAQQWFIMRKVAKLNTLSSEMHSITSKKQKKKNK